MDFDYGYTYNYSLPGYSGVERFLSVFLSIYLIVITVIIIFAIVKYIFHSIGLYTIGKRLGKDHAWLAFIPFARNYFHGELAGEIVLKSKSIKNPGIWKLVLPIIYSAVSGIFTVVIVVFIIAGMAIAGASYNGYGSPAAAMGILGFIALYVILIAAAVLYSAVFMALNILVNTAVIGNFTAHNMAIVHSVFSAVIPLYEAFCLFIIRNREFYAQEGDADKLSQGAESQNNIGDIPE